MVGADQAKPCITARSGRCITYAGIGQMDDCCRYDQGYTAGVDQARSARSNSEMNLSAEVGFCQFQTNKQQQGVHEIYSRTPDTSLECLLQSRTI